MRIYISIILTTLISNLFGQDIKQSPNWFDIVEGRYELKSLSHEFQVIKEVEPQLSIDSLNKNTAYLIPEDDGILLFSTNSPTSKNDIAGSLIKNSLIELLEINYQRTFQNTDSTRRFSHEVWYKFRINNQVYYTDYKIHTLSIDMPLTKLSQIISIASQDTGYDNYYDKGYPEYFHILVFDKNEGGLSLKFDSKELDLECNCEFWEPELESYHWKELENGSLFIKLSGLEQTYSAIWNGEKLIEKQMTGNKR